MTARGDAALQAVAAAAPLADWEGTAGGLLQAAMAPWAAHWVAPWPDVWLAPLLFLAPGATLSIDGRPAIAIGLDRFGPGPPHAPPRGLYHPAELTEIVPHEAAHAVRMAALGLPPTPRALTLAEMIVLEGTALCYTDALVGRPTVTSFLPATACAWHETHAPALWDRVARDLSLAGMAAFHRYFGADNPISGYYMGWWLCRRCIARSGRSPADLVVMPTEQILAAG